MKVAVLYSGGKDSNMALYKAKQLGHDIVCLITLAPLKEDSWMFHFPNIKLTKLQAKALNIPLIYEKTKGEKEKELKDLVKAVRKAIKKYKIKGLVSGALESRYQKTRIDKICKNLGLKSMAPLWHINHKKYLEEVSEKFETIITAVSAEGLDEKWLGRKIDKGFIKDIEKLHKRYGINMTLEGGEGETFVLDGPFFKKKIRIIKLKKTMENECTGKLVIEKAMLL